VVFTALMLHGTTGAFLGPAIAAISLGVVGHLALPVRQRLCASRSSFCSLSIVSACLFPVDCEAEVGSVNLTFMNVTSLTTRHRTSHCNEVISQRVGRL
jgi:uncharacterized protein YqgC (DUF456 family)